MIIETILLCFVMVGCFVLLIGTIGKIEREEEIKFIAEVIKGLRYNEHVRGALNDPVEAPKYIRKVHDACYKEYGADSLVYRSFIELKRVIEDDLQREGKKQ